MSELISLREAGKRLGISDTMVRKHIKSGRLTVAEHNVGNWRPMLAWPDAEREYRANVNDAKRTHKGPTGTSQKRSTYADPATQRFEIGSSKPPESEPPTDFGNDDTIPDFNTSRAAKEFYLARAAKIEVETKEAKLVSSDEVKAAWFKHITAAKTRIMGIPAACKTRRADLPLEVIALIEAICRDALEDLAGGANGDSE